PYACTPLDDGITSDRGEIEEHEKTGSRPGVRLESAHWTGRGDSKRCAGATHQFFDVDLFKIMMCGCYFRHRQIEVAKNLSVGQRCLVRFDGTQYPLLKLRDHRRYRSVVRRSERISELLETEVKRNRRQIDISKFNASAPRHVDLI